MKQHMYRGLFLVGALSVTAMAAAAWRVPGPQILDARSTHAQYCPQPRALRIKPLQQVRPDSDLLLFLVGMQGRR